MNEKVKARHLSRKAMLYVRQSTTQQVTQNEESRRLQYAMYGRLQELGWRQIEVVDQDLGKSAGGRTLRAGFERIVAEVSLGDVGAVAAREVSRFARNSRDWQKLIEVCRLVDTILVDHDAVYDTRLGNDRLLLGLKGSLNEYELELLRLRAQEARREKAKRGEFIAKVAVGYRKGEDGRLEKSPDQRVQHVLALVFQRVLALGSARQVLLWIRENDIEVPVNRNHRGMVIWKAASYGWLRQVLSNPIYAGAYAYGRTKTVTGVRGGEPLVRVARQRREDWNVLLKGHHEAYISWEEYESIQQLMANNAQRQKASGAAKRGQALLAGLLRCRRCAQRLAVSYSGQNGRVHRYCCSRRNLAYGDPHCVSFSGIDVDEEVARNVLAVVKPAGIEATLAAEKARESGAEQLLETLLVEQKASAFAEDLARRQFDAVDPANRLVADELERRWNAALERRAAIELRIKQYEDKRTRRTKPDQYPFGDLAQNLGTVWNDPQADIRLKKRIVRTLIEEIIVDVREEESDIVLVIHWKGGVHTELTVRKRRRGENRVHATPDVVNAIRSLALVCPDEQIARWLNHAGVRTGRGNVWTKALIASFRSERRIPTYSAERKAEEGWLMLEEAAAVAGVSSLTLKRAVARGIVTGRQPLAGGPWLFRREELLDPSRRDRLKKRRPRARKGAEPSPRQLALGIPRR